MGSTGSTRWGHRPKKKHTNSYMQVDIRQLKRDGHLKSDGPKLLTWIDQNHSRSTIEISVNQELIRFAYSTCSSNGRKTSIRTAARVEYMPVNYGGVRVWFRCPCCEQRCAIVYMSERVACRKCFNLAYRSQSEPASSRAVRKANKSAGNLNIDNALGSIPLKPKGMHCKTYRRLVEQYERDQFIALSQLRY